MAPDRARGQAALGVWLTDRGRIAEASPHLAAARQTFTELRASGWLRELDASALVVGGRVGAHDHAIPSK